MGTLKSGGGGLGYHGQNDALRSNLGLKDFNQSATIDPNLVMIRRSAVFQHQG